MICLQDKDLKELVELELLVKPMLKRINEIKELCKLQGSFYTANYVCSVKSLERRGLPGLAEVQKAIGKDILEEYGLIKVSSFLIVHVAPIAIKIDRTY